MHTLTMNGGETALAFDNEAHCECGVAVGGGSFVGHDQLQAGVDCVCCVGGFWGTLCVSADD